LHGSARSEAFGVCIDLASAEGFAILGNHGGRVATDERSM
jgi:hypothetical protein